MKIQKISTYKNIKQLGATAAAALAIIAATPKESNAQQIYTNMYGNWVKLEDYQALEKKIENYKSTIRVNERFYTKYKEQLEPYSDTIEILNQQYQALKGPYDQLKAENDARRKHREMYQKEMSDARMAYIKQSVEIDNETEAFKAKQTKNWANYLLWGFVGTMLGFLGKLFKFFITEDKNGVKCKSQK